MRFPHHSRDSAQHKAYPCGARCVTHPPRGSTEHVMEAVEPPGQNKLRRDLAYEYREMLRKSKGGNPYGCGRDSPPNGGGESLLVLHAPNVTRWAIHPQRRLT